MKIRKIISLILVLLLSVPLYAGAADDAIGIVIDGKTIQMDVSPVIRSNRTLVPLRGVFEALGAAVDWNRETMQAIIKNDSVEILLTADTSGVLVNGRLHQLDAPATLIDDRLLIPIRFVAEALGHEVGWDPTDRNVLITTKTAIVLPDDGSLPEVGSKDNLIQLLKYSNDLHGYIQNRFMMIDVMVEPELLPTLDDSTRSEGLNTTDDMAVQESEAMPAMEKSSDYSGTNNQVDGVDEGDLIKTNGTVIAIVSDGDVRLIDPHPNAPQTLSELSAAKGRGSVSNLYLTDDRLVMIGTSYVAYGIPKPMPLDSSVTQERLIAPPYYNTTNTFILSYDISDPTEPDLVLDMDFEGRYVSSRLIDDSLYMVTNKSLNYWSLDNMSDYEIQPKYADNLADESMVINYEDIRYFPDYIAPSVMMTVGIDLADNESHVEAYLGSGETVYATADKLYLGFTHYEYAKQLNTLIYVPNYTKTTSLYRFGMEDSKVTYEYKGNVPGSLLNQFSLDEYKGHLRIATTTGEMWDESNLSKNNLYILDEDMTQVGSVTDLAPGERIYSTRFHKDRVYMETYRQVDPFFVIDASDPREPEVLGQLKIPGFSTYMHILDENHVLGFGTETNEDGTTTGSGGLKLSLFDVTDPANPTESKKDVIGFAGTYSEIQNNHKALMISLSKGLMGFPIRVATSTPYSQDFSGAYVYDLSTDSFAYRGSVSHKGDGSNTYNYLDDIYRLVYINDYLYTFSRSKMTVSTLDDLNHVSDLVFP